MILIFSQNFDPPTCDVMDWIIYAGEEAVRVNYDDAKLSDITVHFDCSSSAAFFVYKGRKINLSDIGAYWYRRGGFPPMQRWYTKLSDIAPESFKKSFSDSLEEEVSAFYDHLYYILATDKPKIGDPQSCRVNKLNVLREAAACGLRIPATMITTRKSELLQFRQLYPELITKTLAGGMLVKDGQMNGHFFGYTERIDDNLIEKLPETFFISQLQENIQKLYELRVFYLAGEFYAMAIFSQSDEQTKTDFRKYNTEKGNRNVPYKLPADIETKLDALMKRLGLESGSIDIIVTDTKEYIFLEVNPVGQFGMVSGPCNYYLEQKIADYLIRKKNESKPE